jgi:hypothetical protein
MSDERPNFEDIAKTQCWDADEQLDVLFRFIKNQGSEAELGEFAARWVEEQERQSVAEIPHDPDDSKCSCNDCLTRWWGA